jgi:hypothetical protein
MNLLTPSLDWVWYLKMEAATSFGMPVITYKTAPYHNPENQNLNFLGLGYVFTSINDCHYNDIFCVIFLLLMLIEVVESNLQPF